MIVTRILVADGLRILETADLPGNFPHNSHTEWFENKIKTLSEQQFCGFICLRDLRKMTRLVNFNT